MKEILLGQGKYTIVDGGWFEELNQWKWYVSSNGYVIRNAKMVNGKRGPQIHMHRIILNTPEGMQTDHINGNRLDNRKTNLRVCTNSENLANQRPIRGGSSKFKGVTWHNRDKMWMSYIRKDHKRIHLGYFNNEAHAAEAYDRAAMKLFGEFSRLNFPQDQEHTSGA